MPLIDVRFDAAGAWNRGWMVMNMLRKDKLFAGDEGSACHFVLLKEDGFLEEIDSDPIYFDCDPFQGSAQMG